MRCSILVQAADTYLHIVTDSADMTQIQATDSDQYEYSRGLAPWCLDRPRVGFRGNVNYWGCGISYDEETTNQYVNNNTL